MRAHELFDDAAFGLEGSDAARKIADATRRKSDAARTYQNKLKVIAASDRSLAAGQATPARRCREVANGEKRAQARAQYQSALSRAEAARRTAMALPNPR